MKLRNLVFSILTLLLAANFAIAQQHNLLFYGGDVNPDDPNAYAFPNGNTLAQPDTHTYGCFTIPYTQNHPRAGGFLFNVTASGGQDGNIFDPMVATYEVHRTIGDGNPGIVLTTGTAPILVTPTGRVLNGMTEYAVQLFFSGSKRFPFGGAYCINVTPQCTNADNANCSTVQFFVDNTDQTNAIRKKIELPQYLWVYSPSLGYNWVNWCELGLNQEQCSWMSFGVYGP